MTTELEPAVDFRIAGIAVGVAVIVGVVFGIAPAFRAECVKTQSMHYGINNED